MPDDYYVSQYSGEEIDAAVGRAATGGALDKRIATFVNPNLLDNWYFAYPVNQRNVSGPIDAVGYFLDRWKLVSGSVTIGSNGITLNGTIVQILETAVGTDVTASALTTEGVVVASYDNNSKTFSLTGTGQTFVAAKLELGSQQTLAHQDSSGNWVLNEVPNYADTLRACQRYYVNMVSDIAQYAPIGIGVARSATEIQGKVSVPVQMRALPTISTDAADWLIVNGGNYLTSTGITVNGMSPVLINITISGQGFSTGAAYELFVNPGAKISLSAEL